MGYWMWHLVYGIWDMGYVIYNMGYGIWDTVYGIFDIGYGIWVMGYWVVCCFPRVLFFVPAYLPPLLIVVSCHLLVFCFDSLLGDLFLCCGKGNGRIHSLTVVCPIHWPPPLLGPIMCLNLDLYLFPSSY